MSRAIFFTARLKGKFKLEGISSTNPIAVGDFVEIERDDMDGDWMIVKIYPRKNYINRVSPHNKWQHHIIASNIDQSLLFATIKNPKTSLGFIDRFLISSEAFGLPTIIVFNKIDLLQTKSDFGKYNFVKNIYENIGYNVIGVSVATGESLDDLQKLLTNKTTLLSGHSGVGKSSFINYLFPEIDLKTADVSEWSGKGKHTTTFAETFDLPFGGRIIDTPGIREMGIADIDKDQLSHYFVEMRALIGLCKYNNCVHFNEPGCVVKLAVVEGKISEERYLSYLSIRDSIL